MKDAPLLAATGRSPVQIREAGKILLLGDSNNNIVSPMKLQLKKLCSRIASLPKIKLRIISGMLLVSSAVVGYLSKRKVITDLRMSRIYIPADVGRTYVHTSVYYIWELVGVAVLLFITALTLLILSFKKK